MKTFTINLFTIISTMFLAACGNLPLPPSMPTPIPVQQPQQPSYQMPFAVKIDGQNATVLGNNDTFGTISNPVSANAMLEADTTGQIIINIFKSDSNGSPDNSVQPKIIIINKSTKTKLSATMDKSKLSAGTYLMNVVGGGTTSRVVFTVK